MISDKNDRPNHVFVPPLRCHTVEYKQRRSRGALRLRTHSRSPWPAWLRKLGEAALLDMLASVIVEVGKMLGTFALQAFMG